MTTAREELIAQWRQKLADAQDTVATDPRRAWLAAMRVRLYKFLLSCYSASPWNTTPAPRRSKPTAAFMQAPNAGEFSGKPPKSLDQIQAVLNSVASAQDHTPEPGPLVDGLSPDSWVVVAAASSNLRTGALVLALTDRGIEARETIRGDDTLVEVRARNRMEARGIINEVIRHRRARLRFQSGNRRISLLLLIYSAVVVGPFIGLIACIVAIWANAQQRSGQFYLPLALFFGTWASVVILAAWMQAMTWFVNWRHNRT